MNRSGMLLSNPQLPSEFSLLQIEPEYEDEWFTRFQQVQDDLSKHLVLIAIMQKRDLIEVKESAQMKRFIMGSTETKLSGIISSFLRTKSLFDYRCDLRGHLGLPRQRTRDSRSLQSSAKKMGFSDNDKFMESGQKVVSESRPSPLKLSPPYKQVHSLNSSDANMSNLFTSGINDSADKRGSRKSSLMRRETNFRLSAIRGDLKLRLPDLTQFRKNKKKQ